VLHTAEANVVAGAAVLALVPGADDIARAELFAAEEGSAALHAHEVLRASGIEVGERALGVLAWALIVVVGAEIIGTPLPDVACHVVQAVAVGREGADRRGAFEAILLGVLERKFALPVVRHELAARPQLVAPRIFLAVEASACGKFPLGFR